MGNLNFFFFSRANPNMLIFKIFLFYFFNWVIKIILGFFFFFPAE